MNGNYINYGMVLGSEMNECTYESFEVVLCVCV